MAGMAIAATSAATASFTGLRGLALVAGWPERLAWLLPVTIDAYAMTSARVWLAPVSQTRRARRFARANAIGAIATSIVGNAAYHAISVHLLAVSWPIVVVVGAIPAAVLGLTAHLHAVRTPVPDDGPPSAPDVRGTGTRSGPPSGTGDGPPDGTGDGQEVPPGSGTRVRSRARSRRPVRHRAQNRTPDGLLAAARDADERYRAAHGGRPITRDALRTALRIAGPRATELRRQLATEHAASPVHHETVTIPDRKEAHPTR